MKMKDELDRAMAELRLDEAQKAAILQAAQSRQPRAQRWHKRAILLAAVLIVCLTVTAAAVSLDLFSLFHSWLRGFDEAYQPQEGAVVDQGIEIRMVGVLYDSTQLEMLFTMKDIEGDRLNGEVRVSANQNDFLRGYVTTAVIYSDVLEYREEEGVALYHIRYCTNRSCNVEDVDLHIDEIYHEWHFSCDIDMDDPPIGEILQGTPGIRLLDAGVNEDGAPYLVCEAPDDQNEYDLSANLKEDDTIAGKRVHTTFRKMATEDDRVFKMVYERVEEQISQEDLEKIKTVQVSGICKDLSIPGDWVLPLDIESEEWVCKVEDVTINRDIIQQISVSSVAVRVESKQQRGDMASLGGSMVTVKMKDGSEITAVEMGPWSAAYDETGQSENKSVYTWTLPEMIDPEQVQSVILQGVEITK